MKTVKGIQFRWRHKILLSVLVVLCVFCVVVYWSGGPKITVAQRVFSPDQSWVASVDSEQYASMFTEPFFRVVLMPKSGLFGIFEKHAVYEFESSDDAPPIIHWDGARTLRIQTLDRGDDITIKQDGYKDVVIEYESRP